MPVQIWSVTVLSDAPKADAFTTVCQQGLLNNSLIKQWLDCLCACIMFRSIVLLNQNWIVNGATYSVTVFWPKVGLYPANRTIGSKNKKIRKTSLILSGCLGSSRLMDALPAERSGNMGELQSRRSFSQESSTVDRIALKQQAYILNSEGMEYYLCLCN